MSRFNAKEVNETWELEVLESGRKQRSKSINGRIVTVWESDIKDKDGNYPVFERYLLNWGVPVVVDGGVTVMNPLWVSKPQFKDLLKRCRRSWANGGIEDLIHVLAKFLDAGVKKIGDEINDEFVSAVASFAAGKIKNEFLTKEVITTILKITF